MHLIYDRRRMEGVSAGAGAGAGASAGAGAGAGVAARTLNSAPIIESITMAKTDMTILCSS